MYNPSVSVIVNTTNRGNHLKRLLDCLAKQTYDNFEVIVVNGPSTDNTADVLRQYKGAIRVEDCPELNLCKSRNIGVRASSGEILAFIDDDAVPFDCFWLEKGVSYFCDKKIGIVGGTSYRIDGNIEFRYGKCSVWGENITVRDEPEIAEEDKGIWFARAQGNNMLLRREAVVRAGGFDGYYEYFLDESDLAIRIQQKGYTAVYAENSSVIHEAAKGDFRKSTYDLKWDVIAKSQAYYVMKFSEATGKSEVERKEIAYNSGKHWMKEFAVLAKEGSITKEEKKKYTEMVHCGLLQGSKDGIDKQRDLDFDIPYFPERFLRFDKNIAKAHLNICFFCEDDVLEPRGGVQVYTKALAYGLASRGHNVYVVTKGEKELLSNIGGVNLCTVSPEALNLPETAGLNNVNKVLDFSYACFLKLQQLKRSFFVQIAESPIWDSNGLISAYLEDEIPIVTRLQTPLKMVMQTFQMKESAEMELLMQCEAALMDNSDAIITISDCVKDTIEDLYDMKFKQSVFKNYLGIEPEQPIVSKRDDGKIRVFFIGRLERRKGIDSILFSIPHLMEKYQNLEFIFAGDCDIYDEIIGDTYKSKFLKDNRKARWLNNVKFLGKISDEEKEQRYAECDVFVSPSLYESFGIIFLEAMRHGKPVIGCKSGGMQEIIVDKETGLLCEPGVAEDFERCLDYLLANKNVREELGGNAKQRIREVFSTTVMCESCEKIYLKIIKENSERKN